MRRFEIIAVLLSLALPATVAHAEGDAARGKVVYEDRCGGCHALDANRVGPAHRGVYGRKAGGAPGYDYSLALSRSGRAPIWICGFAIRERWFPEREWLSTLRIRESARMSSPSCARHPPPSADLF